MRSAVALGAEIDYHHPVDRCDAITECSSGQVMCTDSLFQLGSDVKMGAVARRKEALIFELRGACSERDSDLESLRKRAAVSASLQEDVSSRLVLLRSERDALRARANRTIEKIGPHSGLVEMALKHCGTSHGSSCSGTPVLPTTASVRERHESSREILSSMAFARWRVRGHHGQTLGGVAQVAQGTSPRSPHGSSLRTMHQGVVSSQSSPPAHISQSGGLLQSRRVRFDDSPPASTRVTNESTGPCVSIASGRSKSPILKRRPPGPLPPRAARLCAQDVSADPIPAPMSELPFPALLPAIAALRGEIDSVSIAPETETHERALAQDVQEAGPIAAMQPNMTLAIGAAGPSRLVPS